MVTSQALAEPPLPVGLGDTAEAKQVTEEPQSEPALPEGLGDLNSSTSPTDSDGLTQPSALPGWRLSGFIDTRIGARTREPIDQESFSLAETFSRGDLPLRQAAQGDAPLGRSHRNSNG